MKNITVSVPDEQYRRARVLAAQQGTSVSSLVAGFLANLDDEDSRFAALESQQHAVQSEIETFSARNRLSREAVHERVPN